MHKIWLISVFVVLSGLVIGQDNGWENPLSDKQIMRLIDKSKPSKSKILPADIKNRLVVATAFGQYSLTQDPIVIEEAKKLNELGYTAIKLSFGKVNGNQEGYNFHSDWKLTKEMSLRDMATHPYYKEVLNMPFKTIVLNINDGYAGAAREDQTETLDTIEHEFYDLTKYLLREYRNRDVSFILTMQYGDSALRGGAGEKVQWKKGTTPPDISFRVKNMIDWLNARQKGVNRARNEMGRTICKVFNAAEVNKLFDGIDGIPSITTSVLPKTKLDMISWAASEGKSDDGLKMFKAIDFIRQKFVPTDYMNGKKVVILGDIGEAENMNNQTHESIRDFWDVLMGVSTVQNITYVFLKGLYCNETKDGSAVQDKNRNADELKGYWLIKPDGTKSWTQEYFDEVFSKGKK